MRIFQPTITGSAVITGNLEVAQGITGSLFGTSSWAITASYAENGGGGGGTPGGSNFEVQFNSGSSFSGSSNFKYDYNTSKLQLSGSLLLTGSIYSSGNLVINNETSGSSIKTQFNGTDILSLLGRTTTGSSANITVTIPDNTGQVGSVSSIIVNPGIKEWGYGQYPTTGIQKEIEILGPQYAEGAGGPPSLWTVPTTTLYINQPDSGFGFFTVGQSAIALNGNLFMEDGFDLDIGNGTTGSVIGYTNAKLGFFGATPVTRSAAVTSAQGIADALTRLGLLVTSSITGSGGSTTPGGSNTQIQYNNSNTFGGVPTLTYNGTILTATGSFTGSLVGSLTGTASYANQAATASYVLNAISSSFASTASYVNPLNQNVILTGSLTISGSATGSIFSVSASYLDFDFDSFLFSGSTVFQSALDATQAVSTFGTASITFGTITGSFTGSLSGSLFGTGSWAISSSRAVSASRADSALSSSFASTASYILNAISSSFASTASFVNPLNQTLIVSGSTLLTGSLGVTGSVSITQNITGSRLYLSASNSTATGSVLTVYGSGSTQPVFVVQGSQGELFSITDSLSGSLFSVNDISGLPILEVFSDNTTLMGNYLDPMLITTAKVTQTNSGSFVVYSLPTSSYDTAFFEYSIKSGSNARAGTIMAIQSGSSVNFTETTTTDLGNTSAVTFTVVVTGSNMALTGSSSTGAWTIKSIIRGI